jgi:hypothetical protein
VSLTLALEKMSFILSATEGMYICKDVDALGALSASRPCKERTTQHTDNSKASLEGYATSIRAQMCTAH